MVKKKTENKDIDISEILFSSKVPDKIFKANPLYEKMLKHVVEGTEPSYEVNCKKLGIKVLSCYYGLRNTMTKSSYGPQVDVKLREEKSRLFIVKKNEP